MVYDSIIIRCGEMFLKSGHAAYFVGKLVHNLKLMAGVSLIIKARGRLILPFFLHHQVLQRAFGISSYSLAIRSEKDMGAIQQTVSAFLNERPISTFKIETARSDKTFPLDSRAVNIVIGQYIEKTTAWQCDFHAPAVLVKVEINRKGAYVFTEVIPGAGGLPVGTAGKVHLVVENDADVLAGILMMKRGCSIIPLCIGDKKDVALLQAFSPQKIKSVFFENRLELHHYIQEYQIPLLVTGENFQMRKEHPPEIVVLRPLIGYTKEEIVEQRGLFRAKAQFPTHFE